MGHNKHNDVIVSCVGINKNKPSEVQIYGACAIYSSSHLNKSKGYNNRVRFMWVINSPLTTLTLLQ